MVLPTPPFVLLPQHVLRPQGKKQAIIPEHSLAREEQSGAPNTAL
jgi:hypothetical protein